MCVDLNKKPPVPLMDNKRPQKTDRYFIYWIYFTVARLLTPKIASYYEEYYKSRGIKFVKGTVLSSFDFDDNGKVNHFIFWKFIL